MKECTGCTRMTAACEQCETCEDYYCPDCLYFHQCEQTLEDNGLGSDEHTMIGGG